MTATLPVALWMQWEVCALPWESCTLGKHYSLTLFCFWSPCCWGVSTNPNWCMGHTAWHFQLPHPMETNPKTSLNPVGTTDPLPSSIQAALQENKSEGTHRGQPHQRPGHSQNHIQPSHWCSSCWTLLSKHCHQPRAPLGVSLCRRVAARPPPALWHCHASPSIIPAGWVLLTITGKEQRDCCVLQHTLPALMGLKGRWGSGQHSKLGGSLLWEQSYARPASSKARSPVFPPCRIQRGPLEGCRGFLCTAFPQQTRSCRLYSTFYQGLKQWQRIFFSCPVLYKKSLLQREYLLQLELLGVCPTRNINY